MQRITARALTVAAFVSLTTPLGLGAGTAGAHADADVVAVPAGAEAVVTLRPTHGCDGSPTVDIRLRADVAGATAVDVPGWTATVSADAEQRTVVQWSGGSLPADEHGAFPIRFTVPNTPGVLLRFPSVQLCANGERLNWTSESAESPFPAPRVLVLPAGSKPAATIDDVPADAPGRELLTQITDGDNPAIDIPSAADATTAPTPSTEAAPPTEPAPQAGGGTAGEDATEEGTTKVSTTEPDSSSGEGVEEIEDGGTGGWVVAAGVALLIVLIGSGIVVGRKARPRP